MLAWLPKVYPLAVTCSPAGLPARLWGPGSHLAGCFSHSNQYLKAIACSHERRLTKTTLNNGYLGSRNDEERSEMRYVV